MLNPELLQEIAACINAGVLDAAMLPALRQNYPRVHFTYCMDDDLPNSEPAMIFDKFNLYLVDGREHCLCLTSDYQHATGVVIAEVHEDNG